ncbi:hypothetical protein [Desulfobotulus mexicanus]|uniref:Type VI secretion system baseplate subunit TssG n=1 Tax=Desulfobotulus mexicanus TaxID=2586642 RepID=A0A5S5MDX4_9BACT|nr:hypothetical protein [Desulfobotulus mexicanus]TYT73912.1 hypothetical protein FIM25_12800 [Desulfobotulus mexicanus]
MASFEGRIRKRIRDCDALSLMRLLMHHGYKMDQIFFLGHPDSCSRETLFEDIRFFQKPYSHVLISVNMGLLSAQSPLPSYFFKRMESHTLDALSFIQFIHYFDHFLLLNFFRSVYPESDTRIYSDYQKGQRSTLQMLSLRSPVTLHWVMDAVFPELTVHVRKGTLKHHARLNASAFILGTAVFGRNAVLGGSLRQPARGLRVEMFTDSETAPCGLPWMQLINRRLEEIVFPVLGAVGVELEIFLVLSGKKNPVQLRSGASLGYDVIEGGDSKHRILPVFSGCVLE